jgi:hypothetical protein
MGKIKNKFYDELYSFINYNMKHGCLDEEEADRVLNEYTVEQQQDWLSMMEVKAEMQIEAWLEQQEEMERNNDNT